MSEVAEIDLPLIIFLDQADQIRGCNGRGLPLKGHAEGQGDGGNSQRTAHAKVTEGAVADLHAQRAKRVERIKGALQIIQAGMGLCLLRKKIIHSLGIGVFDGLTIGL